jgi:hypothetical protein
MSGPLALGDRLSLVALGSGSGAKIAGVVTGDLAGLVENGVEGFADLKKKFGLAEGFLEVAAEAVGQHLVEPGLLDEAGGEKGDDLLVEPAQLVKKSDSVHAGHVEIEDYEAYLGLESFVEIQSLETIGGGDDAVAFIGEDSLDEGVYQFVVIDDHDELAQACGPASGEAAVRGDGARRGAAGGKIGAFHFYVYLNLVVALSVLTRRNSRVLKIAQWL